MMQNGEFFDGPETDEDYELIDRTSVDYDCEVSYPDGARFVVRSGHWRKTNNL